MTNSDPFSVVITSSYSQGSTLALVTVTGEFDRLQTDAFDEAVAELRMSHAKVVVDLTQTTIIDSAALGAMIRLRHLLDAESCELSVHVSQNFQSTVMEVGGLLEFLSVEQI